MRSVAKPTVLGVSLLLPRSASLAAGLALALVACGGAKPDAKGPDAASGTKDAGKTDGAKTDEKPETAPAAQAKPSCADGSCVECGDGICPNGFYCEKGKGSAAPACAWAAPCVEKPTCACLAPHVKGCSCQDKGGIAFVQCGG